MTRGTAESGRAACGHEWCAYHSIPAPAGPGPPNGLRRLPPGRTISLDLGSLLPGVRRMRRGAVAEHADLWGHDDRPELADITRMARRLVRQAVLVARSEDGPVQRVLRDHLGPDAASRPVVSGSWQGYDHVNVQAGLDAWLAAEGRAYRLAGVTGFRHMDFGLADLLQPGRYAERLGLGSVATTAVSAGPAGGTRARGPCRPHLVRGP